MLHDLQRRQTLTSITYICRGLRLCIMTLCQSNLFLYILKLIISSDLTLSRRSIINLFCQNKIIPLRFLCGSWLPTYPLTSATNYNVKFCRAAASYQASQLYEHATVRCLSGGGVLLQRVSQLCPVEKNTSKVRRLQQFRWAYTAFFAGTTRARLSTSTIR
jgi:hypothetical protein